LFLVENALRGDCVMDRNILIKPLEEIPLGNWQLTINGSADVWQNQDNVEKLNNNIKSIYDEVYAKLPGVCILKAVIFSNQFKDDVFKYQKALGYGEHLSDCADGYVAGKTLRWGNGEVERTYAIIIHPEEVAQGIIQDMNFCNAAFAHELGHVFEGLLLRKYYSIDDRIIHTYQWDELRESIAQSAFGEFFAQIIAFPYMDNEEYEGHVMFTVDVLKSTLQDMEYEIAKYRLNHDINHLWQYTIEKLSFLYAQLGRSLGVIHQLSNDDAKILHEFLKALEEVSLEWKELINELFGMMKIKEEFEYEKIHGKIAIAIRKGFDLVGVIPNTSKEGNQGLYIDVPFR